MQWRKLGCLYRPDGRQPWARTHAMLPTPLLVTDEIIRVYFAHLDERSVGRVAYLDVAVSNPARPIAVSEHPVLDVGEPGTFDDNGVVPCCAVREGGKLLLYYYGFQRQDKIPYTIFSGLATSDSIDGPFRRVSRAPILDRTDADLHLRSAPVVMHDGGRWRMWHVGGSEWLREEDGKRVPLYSIRHVESDDPARWPDTSAECLVREPHEIGFGRPFVLRDKALYRMWYSIRTTGTYRIGYATSRDGVLWTRRDGEAGIEPSSSGWDSEMICFAAVVLTKDKWIMFYNGNGYGRTGLGVAVAEPT